MFSLEKPVRQIRIVGILEQVDDKTADAYYNSRAYDSRIGAWASNQNGILKIENELLVLKILKKI